MLVDSYDKYSAREHRVVYMGARIRVVRGAWAGAPMVIGGGFAVEPHCIHGG